MSTRKRHLKAGALALLLGQRAAAVYLPAASHTSDSSESSSHLNGQDVHWPSSSGIPASPYFNNHTMHNQSTFLNGGYWPAWKGEVDTSCVDVHAITHVNFAFAMIGYDGSIQVEVNEGLVSWIRQRENAPGLKVILAVGGGTGAATLSFASMAANPTKMQQFVRSVRDTVNRYNLDGIDIDWEYPGDAEQGQQFLTLMTALRNALPSPLRLSTALPAGEWILQYIPLVELAKQIDYLNLMAYDFVGANFANVAMTGHQAKLFSTPENGGASGASAVEYLTQQGFPVNKTLLGVPLYGRGFAGATGINQQFGGGGGAEYVVKELPLPGMKEYFDNEAVAAFAVGNGQFITYDNQESVRAKAQFVRERGLAGLFYWQLAGDRCSDESLVRAGFVELNNNRTAIRSPPENVSASDVLAEIHATSTTALSSTEQR